MLKGNHDYWWTTITNMRNYIKQLGFQNIDFLHNNSYCFENFILVGTRGWSLLESENSQKMLKREKERLKLSIENGIKAYGDNKPIIAFFHYPPVSKLKNNESFIEIMKEYSIKECYYGHLHGASHKDAIEGEVEGISCNLVSADYLNFELRKIK